ncbi:hypothetical protein NLI96_g4677 [Meripilus lineatus]|uniref:Epoxide hydrolase N-terminal domain-containing protein n=1 Tax=Meripilus lineatus TaxID=2056292 RepID=A0AAD5V498_9APHY|nr:hypothetical protein NLI96_g4677 [Physisporinus lineatus]
MSEQPFKLHVSDADLQLLKQKLELTRLPDELDEAGWQYGTPLHDVKRIVARWKDSFDWRAYETRVNTLPQFTRDIEVEGFGSLNIHYVHQRSKVENAIPLLFVHGYTGTQGPGHFMEAEKILPLLVDSKSDGPSFHVVALSLPGYGFSEAPKKKGFAGAQYAEVSNVLPKVKVKKRTQLLVTVVQGGDWGFMVARKLSLIYGHKHVKAWHSNFAATSGPPSLRTNPLLFLQHLFTPYTLRDKVGFLRSLWFQTKGMGYVAEQSTQPQTVGYSLADSPVGLLAWVYEKLVQWTDSYPWTDDEGLCSSFPAPAPQTSDDHEILPVLQWISLYWFSRAGPAASLRIYYEVGAAAGFFKHPWSSVPLGLSYFPKELLVVPKTWARTIGKVVFEAEHDSGGHFAAHEKPSELVGDLKKMFGKDGPAFGIVPGKNGYGTA